MLMSTPAMLSSIHGLRRNSSCGWNALFLPSEPKMAYRPMATRSRTPKNSATFIQVFISVVLQRGHDEHGNEIEREDHHRENAGSDAGLMVDQPGYEDADRYQVQAPEQRRGARAEHRFALTLRDRAALEPDLEPARGKPRGGGCGIAKQREPGGDEDGQRDRQGDQVDVAHDSQRHRRVGVRRS